MKIEEYLKKVKKELTECRETFASIDTVVGLQAAAPALAVALQSVCNAELEQIHQDFEREMLGERVKGAVLETQFDSTPALIYPVKAEHGSGLRFTAMCNAPLSYEESEFLQDALHKFQCEAQKTIMSPE